MKVVSSYSRSDLCFECAHYYYNNRDLKKDGFRGNTMACRAYPDEIPYNYPEDGHEKLQYNQVGTYLFEKVSNEMFLIADTDERLSKMRFLDFGHY
jgi:hypothetical protein